MTVALLAEYLSAPRARRIPHPRVAALVGAVRGVPTARTLDGDPRFVLTGPTGESVHARLDELPLADGVPAAVPVPGPLNTPADHPRDAARI